MTSATATATSTLVSGTQRFKYFKRPVMPRVNAYPPQVLLAPSASGENNPLMPNPEEPEANTKTVEVQTLYRESESQTTPYTPDYAVKPGDEPEVLLLKNLTYENGLPLGKKEIEMIDYARAKREIEMNLPPFTDEASLTLRKKLMEEQELREFRMREKEIDQKRNDKIDALERVLTDREESNEFMSSQRLESVRLLRMEEREKILSKIKNKRIKALRRLAHQRNISDPVLSGDREKDIIDAYFDRGSTVYAPVKRDGRPKPTDGTEYEIASRTVPLDNIGNLTNLEYSIPKRMVNDLNKTVTPAMLSKTGPAALRMREGPVIKAAEQRLTSAAQRSLRKTKRDIEEMHQILLHRKNEFVVTSALPNATQWTATSTPRSPTAGTETATPKAGTAGSPRTGSAYSSFLNKKPKGRPPTPDYTKDREQFITPVPEVSSPTSPSRFVQDHPFQMAVVLLQQLIRGRAVQNIMFEGKFRRRELIHELKTVDDAEANYSDPSAVIIESEEKAYRQERIRDSTMDAVAGSVSTSLLHHLAQEKARVDMFQALQEQSNKAMVERRTLEAAEAGRRQREGFEV